MSESQRPKTLTVRLDDRSHEILDTLAKVRGQNKTQVLKRMLREEMAREDLLRGASKTYLIKGWEEDDRPLPNRIKITKCSEDDWWYRNYIGCEFTVTGREGMDYTVDMAREYGVHYVLLSDCEVVK